MKEIARYYGLENQMNQSIEEMCELIIAIRKVFRRKKQEGVLVLSDNLIEEIADVKLMIDQLIYLSKSEEKVDRIIDEKILREKRRIKESRINSITSMYSKYIKDMIDRKN